METVEHGTGRLTGDRHPAALSRAGIAVAGQLPGDVAVAPGRGVVPTGCRVRVLGDLFHGRLPFAGAGRPAVYVGRGAPGLPASPFANPHPAVRRRCRHCDVVHDQDDAVAAYARHLAARPELVAVARVQLAEADLACWCPPDRRCHADVLLLVAAGTDPAATLHLLGLPTAA